MLKDALVLIAIGLACVISLTVLVLYAEPKGQVKPYSAYTTPLHCIYVFSNQAGITSVAVPRFAIDSNATKCVIVE